MIKLICLDLDGTTVGKKNVLPKQNIEAIKKATDAGIKVMIATGRGYNSAKPVAEKLDLHDSGYLVNFNGASVNDLSINKEIKKHLISKEDVEKVFAIAKKFNLRLIAYSSDGKTLYTRKCAWIMKRFSEASNYQLKSVSKSPDIEECYKINLISLSKNKIDKLEKWASSSVDTMSIYRTYPLALEFTSLGVSKWTAISELMDEWGIQADEVAAVGDSMNDYEMLEGAKYSFAVANAFNRVKKVASITTKKTNVEGAVAEAIDWILEHNKNER